MQQPPFRASELMELRRKPLTNNQNDSSGGERARVQMLEAEKKIAESLVATAITQKEILRLQTIKTVGLLKDQLAKTETILNNANDKIAFLEEERVRNKETLIENEVMSERLLEMEREIMSATQEHEAIVISMHFEREQFASRLFELEEQMSGEIATAHLAVELSIQERDADASSRCEIQSESNQMCATLQATVEHFKISESNLTNKIESLKLKLSAQIKVDAANKEEIIGLNKDLATTMSRLEIQTEVNEQSAALAAKKEIILQDAIKSAAALAEKECVLQDTITELRSVAEVYGEELVIAKKEVQVYEAQITILQVELEEKRSEASEMRNSTALRISALIALLEGEKDRVTYLEQRLGEFDETAEVERKQRLIELKEHQDIQGMKDEESLQDMSSMRMAVVELNEKLSMTSAQLIEGQENVAKLQVALSTAVSAAELSKLAFLDAEKQLQERLGLSCTEIDIVKGELEENEAKVAVLTVALTSYEDVCARLSHELSLMAQEKDAIISKHSQELSALVEVMRASDTARAVSNERALALESAKAATESEYKKLESIVQSHEAEILSLEIMRSNLSNSSGAQYSALVAQVRTKTAQIDELTLKLAAATAHQQAQGNELYLVLEEIQLEKTEMALKIDTLEACVASKESALAAAEAKAALSAEEVASRESSIRLITEEITELRAELDDAQKELQLKIEEGKASEDTNSVLSDKCTSLKKKVTDMKLELLKIVEQVEAERNKWKEEVALCRQREEVQATATDNLLNTMNRLKEEVWGAFKIKLAEKEREIQGLTLQIEDAQKLKDEAELKTEEALCSLTAANEKCNTLQDEQIESEERQKMLDAASEESRITRENDLLKMQDELTERLSEAESENVSIAWALSILKSRKAESDEKLERALEELSAFEESRTDDLLVSAAIRSETEVAVLTVALAEARAEIESALLDSDDKIGCLTEALEESKKKIQMISSEIEGLRRKLEEAEAKNLSLEGALGDAEGKVALLLSESEDKIASLSIALTESRSTIESLSQAVELSERKASSLHSSLEQSKADNHEKALMISELTRLQTEIDAQLKLSRSNAERSPTKLPRSTTKSNSAQKKKLSIITSEEGNEKGTAGLDGGPVCSSLNISDKEFSHMQGEMRRFRYARDEAKVSMSKMAGRVAILKDQLQEKALAAESACHLEKEFKDKELCRAARVSAMQGREDLLSQVTDFEASIINARSPASNGPSRRAGKLDFSPMMNSPSMRERESAEDDRCSALSCAPMGEEGNDVFKGHSNSVATDIDQELRSRLRAIRLEDDSGEATERTSQLLSARLDMLQKELDAKNQIAASYDILVAEMDKKREENKELKGRIFGLEKTNIMLQQEMSVMRSQQVEVKKAPLLKTRTPQRETKKVSPLTKSGESRSNKCSPLSVGVGIGADIGFKRLSPCSSVAPRAKKLQSVFDDEKNAESSSSSSGCETDSIAFKENVGPVLINGAVKKGLRERAAGRGSAVKSE